METEKTIRKYNNWKIRLPISFALLAIFAFIRTLIASGDYGFGFAGGLGYFVGSLIDPIAFIIALIVSWIVLKMVDSETDIDIQV